MSYKKQQPAPQDSQKFKDGAKSFTVTFGKPATPAPKEEAEEVPTEDRDKAETAESEANGDEPPAHTP